MLAKLGLVSARYYWYDIERAMFFFFLVFLEMKLRALLFIVLKDGILVVMSAFVYTSEPESKGKFLPGF